MRVRFDDLQAGVGLCFGAAGETLVARTPGEVVAVLAAVEEATRRGWWAAGYVSYEAAAGLPSALPVHRPQPSAPFAELPLVWFRLFAAARTGPAIGEPAEDPYDAPPRWRLDDDAASYAQKVRAVRALIAAGETYQANLTTRARASIRADLTHVYARLAHAQRSRHCAYLDTGRYVVASASPELFFDWRGDTLTTRPMKGTARRGRWPTEDTARAAALSASAKDHAENVMIVDLLRNDLGRLAVPGSVQVPQLCALERYPTVWQLTSTVTARARPGIALPEVFDALFPCGSVTGAPKRRTMQAITQLEATARGVYCGAIGVLAPPGQRFRARFAVAIRTVVVDRVAGEGIYGCGGGVTWSSRPASEYAEVVAKTAVLGAAAEPFQLLETMAYDPSRGLRNRSGHLARLAASAGYFGFRFDAAVVDAHLDRALAGVTGPRRVRLMLPRSGTPQVELGPLPLAGSRPVRLAVDAEPVSTEDIFLYHKTTRRAAYQIRAARHPEADDVVLVNEHGQLTQTTIANLAVRLDGAWCTPPVQAGCLPGVERARLLAEGRLVERHLSVADLERNEGLAVINSLRGWRAATYLTGRHLLPAAGRSRVAAAPAGLP